MKNKPLRLVHSIILAALFLPAHAQKNRSNAPLTTTTDPSEPCGNPKPTKTAECEDCKKNNTNQTSSSEGSSCPTNAISSYNGNASREITDLAIAGSVGNMPLSFTRHSNTRLSSRNLAHSAFGIESSWSHNYEWVMRDSGGTVDRPIIRLTYPDGNEMEFQRWSATSTSWLPTRPGSIDRIISNGNDLVLHSDNLEQYHFKRRFHSVTGSSFYRVESIKDSESNTYAIGYDNVDDQLIRQVTDPAGHWIKLHYNDLSVRSNAGTILNTQLLPSGSTGVWKEVNITPGQTFRMLALYQGNTFRQAVPLQVAELEFYDENNVKINGTAFGSWPWGNNLDPAKAFDGSTSTHYRYNYEKAGYVGLDLGVGNGKKVSRIRFRLSGTLNSDASVTFVGMNNDLVPNNVVSHVEGSDGRQVGYDYSVYTEPSGIFQWTQLTAANYADLSESAYTYKWQHRHVMPVLETADDPRYSGAVKKVRYGYDLNTVVGFVVDEYDKTTNQLIVSVRWDGAHIPKLVYPNGKANRFEYVDGNLVRSINSFGDTTDYTYTWNGLLLSKNDPLGRTTTYTRRSSDNRLLSTTTPGGSVTTYTRDTAGHITAVNENGKITSYILDPTTKRRTRTDYPDGTFETWTYNTYGQETTHRLRNGTTESWTYNAAGLLTDHIDETGLLTTYTYNTLNRLASKSRHLSTTEIHTTSYVYDDRGSITKMTHPDGTFVETAYDAYGNPLVVMDERGQLTYYTYDSLNRKTSMTDPMGRITSYDYSSNLGGGCGCNTGARPVLTTYPDGSQTLNSYDKEWRLISTKNAYLSPEQAETTYTYDWAGQRTSMTDPNGSVTTYTYDLDGRVLTTTVASGNALATTTKNTYDVSGNLLESTRAFGTPIAVTTKMTYDNMDRTVSTTAAFGTLLAATSTAQYDTLGQLWKTTDPLNRTTEYLYDTVGRSWKSIAPNGFVSTTTYDAASRVTATTVSNGSSILDSSSMTYDNMDRPVTTTDNDGITTTNTYELGGLLLATSSTNGLTASFEYDANGTRTKSISAPSTPQQQSSEGIYDPVTRIATMRDTLNNTTTTSYDRLGRVISTTNPLNQTTTVSYTRNTTAKTLTTLSTNHAGHISTTVTNARGETQSTTNPNNETIIYYYNALGQNIGYLDAKGATFAFEYDALGRRSKRTEPDATFQSYTYDLVGNMLTHRKADANVATYTYNINNQPLSKIWNGNSEFTTWTYDTHYRLSTITNQNSVIGYTYHGLTNRLDTETTSIGSESRSVTRTYDDNIRLASVGTTAIAHTLSYDYHNASGQLHTINNDGPPPLATYGYTNGLVSAIALENGLTTTTLRDAASQITSSSTNAGTTVKSSVAHGYDDAGRRTYAKYEDNLGQAYSYDNAGQVKNVKVNIANPATAVATASPTHTYNYNSAGNRTSVLDNGLTTNYASNAVNAYTSISGGGILPPTQTPTYDPNGNMLTGPVSTAASSTLIYDRENRLRTITTGTDTVSHTYDALGRLTQTDTTAAADNRERYTWAGWTLLTREIYTGTTSTSTHRYTWGLDLSGSMEGAGGVGGLLAIERNVTGNTTWDIRYPHYDANGNIIALSDSAGNVSARYRYDAFGKTLTTEDTDNSGWAVHNIHGFSTKPNIGATGLLYYGYRHYAPTLGRWINRDPIEESGGVNLYGFVGNSPVFRYDKLGLLMSSYTIGSAEIKWTNWWTDRGLKGNQDGLTSAYWSKGLKTDVKKVKKCFFLSVRGRLKIDIVVRKGSTIIDNFGNNAEQHERVHESISGTWYNMAVDWINPLEGYYCNEKCAKLANDIAWASYDYHNYSAKNNNMVFDERAYGEITESAKYAAEALAALERVKSLREELNNNKCAVYAECPHT